MYYLQGDINNNVLGTDDASVTRNKLVVNNLRSKVDSGTLLFLDLLFARLLNRTRDSCHSANKNSVHVSIDIACDSSVKAFYRMQKRKRETPLENIGDQCRVRSRYDLIRVHIC